MPVDTDAPTLPHLAVTALGHLGKREELPPDLVGELVATLLTGNWDPPLIGAILTAWRLKGETGAELAAAASVLRRSMVRLETGRDDLIDTCGTGGDRTGTFNISTATAFVVAGAGLAVVKNGNRAATSASGSMDVIAALGIRLQPGAAWPKRCLERAGLAICAAPEFHPTVGKLAPIRKMLGHRTVFNCLGPLVNPASPAYQVLGVGQKELLGPMSDALSRLGIKRAFVVAGEDGLDEVSLTGPTWVREVENGNVRETCWAPTDFGLPTCKIDDLRIQNIADSAARIREVLAGKEGPCLDIVLANSAAALLAAGSVRDLREGVTRSRDSIQSGQARAVLEALTNT